MYDHRDRALRVLVVDDAPGVAQAFAAGLRSFDVDDVVVADSVDPEAILATVADVDPHVVLLDLLLGGPVPATHLIAPIRALGPRVLVVTAAQDDELLAACVEAGADGVFDKAQSLDLLLDLVSCAARGDLPLDQIARAAFEGAAHPAPSAAVRFDLLTASEAAVLAALMDGRRVDEIAMERSVALSTVRSQVKAVLRKLGVSSQLAAVALARRLAWSPSKDPQPWG